MKIAVLFGGMSSEHEVSLCSAATVLRNLDAGKYEIYPLGIEKTGKWYLFSGTPEEIEAGTWVRGARTEVWFDFDGNLCTADRKIRIDKVLPVLHGAFGEDGRIQGYFDTLKIPYVGCGCESSAVCMDKGLTKMACKNAGIPQARAFILERSAPLRDLRRSVRERFGYPVFVKPARSGSSVGAGKVHRESELSAALDHAFAYDRKVLIEEYIRGREIEVAVLGGGKELLISQPGEVIPGGEFYDYDDKYKNGVSRCEVPAKLTPICVERLRALAGRVYRLLECAGPARVDFFVTVGERILFNEINTLPGFTGISMYPMMMAHAGLSFSALLDRMLE